MAASSTTSSSLTIKYGKDVLAVSVEAGTTVAGLRRILEVRTGVRVADQRLVGLKAADSALVSSLSSSKPILLVGPRGIDVAALESAAGAAEPASTASVAPSAAVIAPCLAEFAGGFTAGVARTIVLGVDGVLASLRSDSSVTLRPGAEALLSAARECGNVVLWSDLVDEEALRPILQALLPTSDARMQVAAILNGRACDVVTTSKFGTCRSKSLDRLAEAWPGTVRADESVLIDCDPRAACHQPSSLILVHRFDPAAPVDSDTDLRDVRAYLLDLAKLPSWSAVRHRTWRDQARLAQVDSSEAAWMAGLTRHAPAHAQYISHHHHHHEGHHECDERCRGHEHDS